MFTGLIEAVCTVKSAQRRADAMVLSVDLGSLAADCKVGESVAVSGVCLTVSRLAGTVASFDVSGETLAKSTLGRLNASSQVNIERAMGPSDRFGGHFVLGHVDGTATVKAIEKRGEFAEMVFSAGAELLGQMVPKGSVAVDGISLTIAGMDKSTFSVALIPQTLEATTLGKAKIGDSVNIEIDVIVKTVKRQLEQILPQTQGLTAERLRELGF